MVTVNGTCHAGGNLKDVIGTYIWASNGLALTALRGVGPTFIYNVRWGQTGQQIDTSGAYGNVSIGMCGSAP